MTFVRVCCCLALFALFTTTTPLTAQSVSDVVTFDDTNYLGNPGFAPAQGREALLHGSIASPNGYPGAIISFPPEGKSYDVNFTLTNALGVEPIGGLTLGSDGNFYGTTANGGSLAYGVLFKVSPTGNYTVLHDFTGGSDSGGPESGPIEGADGNIYGVTYGSCCAYSTVYKYTRSGVFSTIYIFDWAHGAWADSIMQGSDGNLYVTSFEGGIHYNGTIVKLSPSGKLLSYYQFPGPPGGTFPVGRVVEAPDGNYYGVTLEGGYPNGNYGWGTIFRMTPQGKVTRIYAFCSNGTTCPDGYYPGSLVLGSDGNLYGTTEFGGANFLGTLFRISTSGVFTSLYSFNSAIGENPGALMQDTNGRIYGSASNGGPYGYGAIYAADLSLSAFITFVQPTGKPGHQAQILGQGLTGATAVTFNGVPATNFSVKTDTYMTATVPAGATSGPVVVTTPTATLTSNPSFQVLK